MTIVEKFRSRYTGTSNNIKVSVLPAAIEEESNPQEGVYSFSYTITIENCGDTIVQLMDRYWRICSGEVQLAEVSGPGVVGEQPILEPGEAFQYTSGAIIQDPFGAMEGKYTFQVVGGERFDVLIPKFDLIYSVVYH